ncbi:hypothetical protein [Alistipes sp.]|uniref:hypothetical protein n=1 Tax=Alistipes sp. TaxID=1872444 RepID=UPI003AF14681
MQKVKNFSRFYALAKNIPGDREELKENLVRAFTNGRTISLREMTPDEYNRMCDSLQGSQSASTLSQKDFTAAIKKKRSAVLVRMQKLGVDTSDWAAVDKFCLDPRIAGKEFRTISLDELDRLVKKLEAISAKPRQNVMIVDDPVVDPHYFDQIVALTRKQLPS